MLVLRGQTLFCTEEKGLGHGHRAPRNLISKFMHDVSIAITKVKLATFCTCIFDFYCVPSHDSRHFLLSILLTLQVNSLLKLIF